MQTENFENREVSATSKLDSLAAEFPASVAHEFKKWVIEQASEGYFQMFDDDPEREYASFFEALGMPGKEQN